MDFITLDSRLLHTDATFSSSYVFYLVDYACDELITSLVDYTHVKCVRVNNSLCLIYINLLFWLEGQSYLCTRYRDKWVMMLDMSLYFNLLYGSWLKLAVFHYSLKISYTGKELFLEFSPLDLYTLEIILVPSRIGSRFRFCSYNSLIIFNQWLTGGRVSEMRSSLFLCVVTCNSFV